MADEYIRLEDAIEEIDKWLDAVGTALIGKGMSYYGELIGCIEDTPAADVAPVVRCKDCKYHYDCGVHFCNRLRMDCPDDSDFFCSYGERMRKAKMDGGNENG